MITSLLGPCNIYRCSIYSASTVLRIYQLALRLHRFDHDSVRGTNFVGQFFSYTGRFSAYNGRFSAYTGQVA